MLLIRSICNVALIKLDKSINIVPCTLYNMCHVHCTAMYIAQYVTCKILYIILCTVYTLTPERWFGQKGIKK